MELPNCIKLLKTGRYGCVCYSNFDNQDDIDEHMSKEYPEYCINGLKYNAEEDYECLCGKTGMSRRDALVYHYYEHKGKCFSKKVSKDKSYCKLCNLQCDCPAAYKRHIYSNSHLEKETPTKLDLECKVCNIKYPSQPQIKAHLETKKHKDRVALGVSPETPIPLSCSVCNIQCQSQATIKAHLETNKHKKRCLSAV